MNFRPYRSEKDRERQHQQAAVHERRPDAADHEVVRYEVVRLPDDVPESGDDARGTVEKQAEAQKQDRNDRQEDDPLFVVLARNSFHRDTFPFGCDIFMRLKAYGSGTIRATGRTRKSRGMR